MGSGSSKKKSENRPESQKPASTYNERIAKRLVRHYFFVNPIEDSQRVDPYTINPYQWNGKSTGNIDQ